MLKTFMAALLCVLCAITIVAHAAESSDKAEKVEKLLWNGKEISPVCFDQLLPTESKPLESVELDSCSHSKESDTQKTTHDPDGSVVIKYSENGSYTGSTSYRVVGPVHNGFLIEYNWDGGGTGRFSNVLVVDIQGKNMVLKETLSGGDRCNGGASIIGIEENLPVTSVNITPADFPHLAYGDDHGITAYEDLESSAVSCYGKAVYKDKTLSFVELSNSSAPMNEDEEWVSKYKYQKCFNNLFKNQISKKSKLSPPEFKSFMDQFFTVCVKK